MKNIVLLKKNGTIPRTMYLRFTEDKKYGRLLKTKNL